MYSSEHAALASASSSLPSSASAVDPTGKPLISSRRDCRLKAGLTPTTEVALLTPLSIPPSISSIPASTAPRSCFMVYVVMAYIFMASTAPEFYLHLND